MALAAVILAGGHVWRENAIESIAPRLLLRVANVPLVVHVLRWLRRAGIRHITVCANDRPEEARAVLRDGADEDVEIHYFVDRYPRGPGGCLRDAVAGLGAAHVVAVDGSLLPAFDLRSLIAAHVEQRAAATVAVVDTRSRDDDVARMSPAGVYVFRGDALDHIPAAGFQDIKEGLLPALRRAGERTVAHPVAADVLRISGLDTYLEAQQRVLSSWRLAGRDGDLPDYVSHNWGWAHPTASIDPTAHLVGPILIGPETTVGSDAVVVGPTVIGSGCRLGRRSLVARSVLWNLCSVDDGVLVEKSLIADGVKLCAGPHREQMLSRNGESVLY